MKTFGFLAAGMLLLWFGWKLIQSPEKYLKKKTQKLIALTSVTDSASDMGWISKVSKMAKYIHFDVRMKAEYEGQIWTAKSLNEFRSLLFAYFKQGSAGQLDYKNLTVRLGENKKQGLVKFDAFFERNAKTVFCKALLEWVKEKKWRIKQIDVFSCSPVAS